MTNNIKKELDKSIVGIVGCDVIYRQSDVDTKCGSPAKWQIEVIGDHGESIMYYLCSMHKNEYIIKIAKRLGRVTEL